MVVEGVKQGILSERLKSLETIELPRETVFAMKTTLYQRQPLQIIAVQTKLGKFVCRMVVGFLFMLLAATGLAGQATLAITPSTTSNTYYGYLTLQIGGLTSGETVQVDHYFDLNLNGAIDANDILMGSYRITDGQRTVIGGVTNLNVPGDSTGVDGAITAALSMARSEPQFNAGTHLFRLSSPAGNWTPVTNVLTITNVIYAQSITGKAMNGGSAVPDVFVALQQPGGGLFAGTVADGGGNYSIPAPPGSYGILAFKPGYIFNRNTAPFVSLPTNGTVNTNVLLVPATRTLAGSLVDSTNSSHGLPGAFLVLASAGGYFALGNTDTNGNFNAPVNSDILGGAGYRGERREFPRIFGP